MARSTGLPRDVGVMGITRVIAARTRPVTVSRVTESKGSLDDSTTSTTEFTVDMWLHEPRESVAEELTGDRLEGGLGGLVVADGTVDLEHDDRVTYGGVEYSIDTIVGHPEDGAADGTPSDGTDFWMVTFTRRNP